MNQEQKEKKLKYLREQKENPTGNYRKYLVRTYGYIQNDSKVDNRGWSKTTLRKMMNYVYEGNPDHMANELVVEYKNTLRDLGYIKNIKENGEWHTYIIKELDF
ncbi:hypothetical protein NBE98_09710 [Clostridium swellfunianum]|uniref:hypothetical protein n=1 Tax=Clostridium swellfunianum TaxID=1367462 RepID=UPI00202FEA91|nr:hypothetical protein [Clostridium swellfunianum]MCM0648649.1 hypothetical protein [Clostridium swellfunianum]